MARAVFPFEAEIKIADRPGSIYKDFAKRIPAIDQEHKENVVMAWNFFGGDRQALHDLIDQMCDTVEEKRASELSVGS
jgi:hypothetical protein